jgi:hypothetical protein
LFEVSNGREIDDIHVGRHELSLQYEVADEWYKALQDSATPSEPEWSISKAIYSGTGAAAPSSGLRRNARRAGQALGAR